MIVKTSISFLTTDSDEMLIKDTSRILAGLTNNPAYPKATLALPPVKTALDEFTTALAQAGGGGVTLTALKNDKRKGLCNLLRPLASTVDTECKGDLTVLLMSGFPIQKPQHFPIGELSAPTGLTLTLGFHSGELDAGVNPVYGAATYNWNLALASAPSVVVQTVQTTKSSATFSGLTPGQVYHVVANAVGAAGPSDWTTPIAQMVVCAQKWREDKR